MINLYLILYSNYKRINTINNYNLYNNIILNNYFDFTPSSDIIKFHNENLRYECIDSEYNRLYAFYLYKTHINPINFFAHSICPKFCNSANIENCIFLSKDKIIAEYNFNSMKYL